MSGVGVTGPLSDSAQAHPQRPARRWVLTGIVQGVGFRPYVYRLARQHRLYGWVKNCAGQVEIVATGTRDRLQAFESDLIDRAPAIASPKISTSEPLTGVVAEDFRILASEKDTASDIHVPVDYFVCEDCLAELNNPSDRRYRYPFINCTQCGPRYTLIRSLPYDRINTSMATFELCPDCMKEYTDVLDRRFHAEPIACPVCGPKLVFRQMQREVRDCEAALRACVRALKAGSVVAVKGVGGYHLMCDASRESAIQYLRDNKPRPHKPLALMFADNDNLALLRTMVELSEKEEALLRSAGRPIVLARRKRHAPLPESIAPGLDEVGVMLPYSPLHHLLIREFEGPLVATSANISGEPVLTDNPSVEQRLKDVAGAYLHHDRPVVRPADDPVYRSSHGVPRPIRMGRGNAPTEIELPFELKQPVLAVGGHMKNTICLAWERRAVVSPHIGDMGTARSLKVFEQVIGDLQNLYDVNAEVMICDAHPGYASSRWARKQPQPVHEVQHHVAHASALVGESPGVDDESLIFTWDGTGYGRDGSLWGGEAFYGRPGSWQRVASMRPFRLPGGEKAGREPWRSAVALAWEAGADSVAEKLILAAPVESAAIDARTFLYQAWQKNLNTPVTTAAGRLFDAAAAMTGLCMIASYEGQGPMWLEAIAAGTAEAIPLPLFQQADGLLRSDWRPLVACMADERIGVSERAAIFHESMAETLLQQALRVRDKQAVKRVGLCGGVFQNRRLTEACVQRLQSHAFEVVLGERLPINDGGLSFGQVVEYGTSYKANL